jgi:N-acetylmuramoyl-L-alanine amidase
MRFATLFFTFLVLLLSSCSGRHEGPSFLTHREGKSGQVVILDPGHGGKDPGTLAVSDRQFVEKDLALAASRLVKNHLSNLGYRVVLTRNSDRYVTLSNRVRMSNKVRGAIFVSLHFNASRDRDVEGVEVYYYKGVRTKRIERSRNLAQNVLNGFILYTKAESRGIKEGNFEVLRKTVMPAILVEGGFLSNEEELDDLQSPKYLNAAAWGIAKGIDAYLN